MAEEPEVSEVDPLQLASSFKNIYNLMLHAGCLVASLMPPKLHVDSTLGLSRDHRIGIFAHNLCGSFLFKSTDILLLTPRFVTLDFT